MRIRRHPSCRFIHFPSMRVMLFTYNRDESHGWTTVSTCNTPSFCTLSLEK